MCESDWRKADHLSKMRLLERLSRRDSLWQNRPVSGSTWSNDISNIISQGEKFHLVMRRMYDGQLQRHFAGEVDAADGAVVRATGYIFIYDDDKAQYIKKQLPRSTIINLAESGYIVNLVPSTVELADLRYEVIDRSYLAFTDGKDFSLDINEFSTRR